MGKILLTLEKEHLRLGDIILTAEGLKDYQVRYAGGWNRRSLRLESALAKRAINHWDRSKYLEGFRWANSIRQSYYRSCRTLVRKGLLKRVQWIEKHNIRYDRRSRHPIGYRLTEEGRKVLEGLQIKM